MSKEPRAGSVQVAGVAWLARMIDKARLDAQGEIEQYDLEYPCPMDRGLLRELGLSGEEFQQIVMSSENDEEIVAALKERDAIKA